MEQWGLVPLSYLAQFAHSDFTYGYIGNQDFTMYPDSSARQLHPDR